jgi:type II secretory pathway component PulK
MPAAIAILAVSLLHLAVYTEAAVIVVLLLLLLRFGIVGGLYLRQRNRARQQRNEARQALAVLQRMSEVRLDTIEYLTDLTRRR